jgi:hypothetical protein
MYHLITFFIALTLPQAGSNAYPSLNFNATFGSSPEPFTIDVDPAFISETKLKASIGRFALDIDVPPWFDGPPKHNASIVRDYWTRDVKWSIG